MSGDRVQLHQYEPAWGCQAVARLYGIPHEIVNSAYSEIEATGPLPMAIFKDCLAGGDEAQLVEFLLSAAGVRGDGGNTAVLTEAQRADTAMVASVVTSRLQPLVTWCKVFHEAGNRVASQGVWGLSHVLRMRAHTKQKQRLSALGLDCADDRWAENLARSAYQALSVKYTLCGGPFLYGERATLADAIVYGHLASVRNVYPVASWLVRYGGYPLLRMYAAFRLAYFADTVPPTLGARASPPACLIRVSGVSSVFERMNEHVDSEAGIDTFTLEDLQRELPVPRHTQEAAVTADRALVSLSAPIAAASPVTGGLHSRVLTGMAEVDVAARRVTFEPASPQAPGIIASDLTGGLPTDAATGGTGGDGGSIDQAAAAQAAALRLGFLPRPQVPGEEKVTTVSLDTAPVFGLAVTVGIFVIAATILRLAFKP